jgi:hypothetical protein
VSANGAQPQPQAEAQGAQPGPGGPTHSRTLARLVQGKNINEKTLLATDYLNHFNEIIMLLELIPDMPDCLEDAKAWRPKSYVEHFRDSSFEEKELAVLAYENAPQRFRAPFDSAVATMDDLVFRAIENIESGLQAGNAGLLAETVATATANLRRLVDVASAIIHGDEITLDQKEIDSILNV